MEGEPKQDSNNLEEKAAKTKELLSFEEFISGRKTGTPIFNNFPALFLNYGMLPEIVRGQGFFKKFQSENPELEKSLTERLSVWAKDGGRSEDIPDEILRDLYEAYKIMLSYDEIKTNHDLFA